MKARFFSLLLVCIMVLSTLSACQSAPDPHQCRHVCEICQKCLDSTCIDPICAGKCPGHDAPIVPATYQISLPTYSDVDLHTDLQKAYLSDSYTSISNYADGTSEKSIPLPLTLQWQAVASTPDAPSISGYTVELSPNEDFSDSLWRYDVTDTTADIYNLMIGCTYYWRVTAHLENGETIVSLPSTVTTLADGPRNLFVEGITNVRDMGGWQTTSGTSVKQGLLFRCGRLNKSSYVSVEVEITENGQRTMLEQLDIKTEIDLRMTSNGEVGGLTDLSPLGNSVQYVQCPMDYTCANLITGNRQQLQIIFAILSDINNYPIIYHCNIGTDRTGVVAFLVNGLLGVPEETLYRDYLFSNFGNIGGNRNVSSIQSNYVNYIKAFEGDDLSQKIYHCLVENGIPAEYLDSVISILG